MELSIIEPFFRGVGIDNGWLYSLTFGTTKLYNNNTELLSVYYDNEGLNINATSIDYKPFSIGIRRDIMRLVKVHEMVTLACELTHFEQKLLEKYGGVYDRERQIYIKGGTK